MKHDGGESEPEEPELDKKERKRLRDDDRQLDPWERYRALNDALDESYELIDIANREARFALLLMGALNAVLFVVATRTGLASTVPRLVRAILGFVLGAYGAIAVHFFLQAIETLRPRKFRPVLPDPSESRLRHYPAGVRYYEDVVRRDAAGHWRAWREVRIGELNAELAVQAHSLSLKNKAKYVALSRLYAGLRLMTLLVAGLLAVLGLFAVVG